MNCAAPGPVDTAMPKLVHSVAIRQDHHGAMPLSRYGTPEESAAAVVFVCGDDASYIDGQALADDGGFDALGAGLPTLRKQFILRGNRNQRRSGARSRAPRRRARTTVPGPATGSVGRKSSFSVPSSRTTSP